MPIRLFVIPLLLLAALPLQARADSDGLPLLGYHDFQAGGYSLVGLLWNRPRHPLQKELGEFYVDDPVLLAEMQSEWRAGEPALLYACGYHYTILLVRGGEILDSLAISLETECGTIVSGAGSYRFDTTLLTSHVDRYRKPMVEHREFPSLAEARTYLAEIGRDPGLLLKPRPQWQDYDGEFRFMLPCPGHGYDDAKVAARIVSARAGIEAKYPGESFDLMEAGGQDDLVMIEMKCSKALHDRFDLYEDYWEWRDYKPALTLHWKQPE